jgi:hypothetical protein
MATIVPMIDAFEPGVYYNPPTVLSRQDLVETRE